MPVEEIDVDEYTRIRYCVQRIDQARLLGDTRSLKALEDDVETWIPASFQAHAREMIADALASISDGGQTPESVLCFLARLIKASQNQADNSESQFLNAGGPSAHELLTAEARGWGAKDLDPFNKNSGVRKTGRQIDFSENIGQNFTRVSIKNNTGRHIRVALDYTPRTAHQNRQEGWWHFSPGEKAYVVDTKGHIGLFAETADRGPHRWWGGVGKLPRDRNDLRGLPYDFMLIASPRTPNLTHTFNP